MQLLLMSFKEHSRVRRLEQEEDEEGMSGACLLITWRWNEKQEGPERVRRSSPSAGMPYMVARGPYDSNSVWNLLDAAMVSSIPLFTIKEFSNVLRALNGDDQKMFTFAMTRVLSISRLLEARCEGLFKSLREAYEAL
jgi:hypothetical protein